MIKQKTVVFRDICECFIKQFAQFLQPNKHKITPICPATDICPLFHDKFFLLLLEDNDRMTD